MWLMCGGVVMVAGAVRFGGEGQRCHGFLRGEMERNHFNGG